MPDSATSSSPPVQRQLDRLEMLSPGRDVLGLGRITALLARLGNPQHRLPPVLHVAGTNGKGSTCAFLRACVEAAGLSAHVYTSPHLVRFNERIRVADRLIDDEALAPLLEEVLDGAADIAPSFFEATTAAAFLAFARTPADACVVEVGLGGRLDATNVIDRPAATGIAQLGKDHEAFLGDRVEQIAAEKAGIARANVPLVTLAYPPPMAEAVGAVAAAAGARWLPIGGAWDALIDGGRLAYRDVRGTLDLPLPRLAGAHQAMNAALAVAMIRHQDSIPLPDAALAAAMGDAAWPARLQRLDPGPLRDLLPPHAELWLDGGHNPAAAQAIARFLTPDRLAGRPLHLVLGMLANKDAEGFLAPLAGSVTMLHPVPVPGHEHHSAETLTALAGRLGIASSPAPDPAEALRSIAARPDAPFVLIAGSLYLAGRVLEANGQLPS